MPGNNSGEIGVLVAAFNDMLAEIGRRSHALQEANLTLEHEMQVRHRAEQALLLADRRKDEFLATLAHELRNPLAPIRTGLDILRLRSGDAAGHAARHATSWSASCARWCGWSTTCSTSRASPPASSRSRWAGSN